jgi:hypothetical protein
VLLVGLVIGPVAAPDAAGAAANVNWRQFMFNTNHSGFNTSQTTVTRQTVTNLTLEYGALGPSDNGFGNLFDHSAPAVVNGVMGRVL